MATVGCFPPQKRPPRGFPAPAPPPRRTAERADRPRQRARRRQHVRSHPARLAQRRPVHGVRRALTDSHAQQGRRGKSAAELRGHGRVTQPGIATIEREDRAQSGSGSTTTPLLRFGGFGGFGAIMGAATAAVRPRRSRSRCRGSRMDTGRPSGWRSAPGDPRGCSRPRPSYSRWDTGQSLAPAGAGRWRGPPWRAKGGTARTIFSGPCRDGVRPDAGNEVPSRDIASGRQKGGRGAPSFSGWAWGHP
jgi:hypothetical protein